MDEEAPNKASQLSRSDAGFAQGQVARAEEGVAGAEEGGEISALHKVSANAPAGKSTSLPP